MTFDRPALGVAHFSCINLPPLPFIQVAADVGFSAVGLRLHPAFAGARYYTLPPGSQAMREVKTALRDAAIRVYDIEFVVIDEAFAPSSLKPILEVAAELGAHRLSVCGDDPNEQRFIERLAELSAFAAEVGMGVDLEVMPWRKISSVGGAKNAVAGAGASNLAILIDALHLSRSGGAPRDLEAIPPELIQSVQLCDAGAGIPSDVPGLIAEARGGRSAPGIGRLPLVELLQTVPRHSALSVEVPSADLEPRQHLRDLFTKSISVIEQSYSSRSSKTA